MKKYTSLLLVLVLAATLLPGCVFTGDPNPGTQPSTTVPATLKPRPQTTSTAPTQPATVPATTPAPAVRYVSDLPEDAQKLILGEEVFNANPDEGQYLHLFGEFDGVYAVYRASYGSPVLTSEAVNGLSFHYLLSETIKVHTSEGIYGLRDAFEQKIITAEELQTIYDNYYFAFPWLKEE